MVHGILQFTPSIAFRYVLHRCESRDIRCRESFVFTEEARVPPTHAADGARGAGCRFEHSLALSAPGFVGRPPRAPGRARRGRGGGARAECRSTPPARAPRLLNAFAGSFCCAGFDNDPSAGSPTETLLRLLLPLNDKVQWTSRDVAGSEPPTSPRSEHFTGSFNRRLEVPSTPLLTRRASKCSVDEAEEMRARRGSCTGADHTGRWRSPRIGLGRMHAAPGACPESSIQYSPLARRHRLVRILAPAAPSWMTPLITDTSVQ
ncbi:hypothetical protein CQW23_32955 [Capsicum baccatum]|uniref:Protein TAR1 n=1 Tax=Capsicum baccatum TaxID=33114 RepID=A0A2G2V3D9_CAPBA|nr:hypothetical protein CQW23_32955 [Capsicum baccatum]